MKRSILATHLGLTEEELDEMDLTPEELDEGQTEAEGTTFFFNVPQNTPQRILGKKGWTIGERVAVSVSLFDISDN